MKLLPRIFLIGLTAISSAYADCRFGPPILTCRSKTLDQRPPKGIMLCIERLEKPGRPLFAEVGHFDFSDMIVKTKRIDGVCHIVFERHPESTRGPRRGHYKIDLSMTPPFESGRAQSAIITGSIHEGSERPNREITQEEGRLNCEAGAFLQTAALKCEFPTEPENPQAASQAKTKPVSSSSTETREMPAQGAGEVK